MLALTWLASNKTLIQQINPIRGAKEKKQKQKKKPGK